MAMMMIIIKSVVAMVIMSAFINKVMSGNEKCSLENINIGTVRSGREIEGKPEWNVSVINNCACSQSLIQLSCSGFQTTEPVDPSTLLKLDDGDTCLLINGASLDGFDTVSFSYAWDPPFLLLPRRSVVANPC